MYLARHLPDPPFKGALFKPQIEKQLHGKRKAAIQQLPSTLCKLFQHYLPGFPFRTPLPLRGIDQIGTQCSFQLRLRLFAFPSGVQSSGSEP